MKYPYKLLEKNNDSVLVEMKLTNNMDFFDGHFENQPIMPAVAQLFIVEMLALEILNLKDPFSSMRQVKFIGPICPETLIIISISYDSNKGQVNYSYSEKGIVKSKGKLNYHNDH